MNPANQKSNLLILLAIVLLCIFACNNVAENKEPVTPDSTATSEPTARGLDKLNYMRLHDGKFRTDPDGNVPLTNREDLDSTFKYLKTTDSSIVIYFHGGLIPIKKTYTQPLSEGFDNAFRGGEHFPFYVLYGGGPGNTLWVMARNRWFNPSDADEPLVQEEQSPLDSSMDQLFHKASFLYLLGQTKKKFDGNDGFKSSDYQPYSPADTANLEAVVRGEFEKQAIVESIDMEFAQSEKLQKEFEQQLYGDSILQDIARKELEQTPGITKDKAASANPIKALYTVFKIIYYTGKRIVDKRNHYIGMTIIEEIFHNAKYPIVSGLKYLAQKGWQTSKEIVENAFKEGDDYGGSALLQELATINEKAKLANTIKHIWLVGSSTGTVMICELLKASNTPAFSNLRFNIIFSVASCTFKQFGEALDAAEGKISSFYLFGLSDKNERWGQIPFPYAGSILYFVSGVCESKKHAYHDMPLVGMQRFYRDEFLKKANFKGTPGEKKRIERVIRFLNMQDSYSAQVAWSNDTGTIPHPGLDNNATYHGGVIRNKAVQTSITNLLKKSN